MTATWDTSPSPLAPLVDHRRLGSAGGQALTGIAGIVLAVLLVVGQVSLATTKGISAHLHASVQHMTEGNEVMQSVIERAAPSVEMERVLAQQSKTLANTRDTMIKTNAQLGQITTTTGKLSTSTSAMQATSEKLATDVAAVDANTATINKRLGGLPAATDATGGSLTSISTDLHDLNGELIEISRKLMKYGLPRAQGARHT
jgi:septal ring factor EnvC (AmiA/AmiB activator)